MFRPQSPVYRAHRDGRNFSQETPYCGAAETLRHALSREIWLVETCEGAHLEAKRVTDRIQSPGAFRIESRMSSASRIYFHTLVRPFLLGSLLPYFLSFLKGPPNFIA